MQNCRTRTSESPKNSAASAGEYNRIVDIDMAPTILPAIIRRKKERPAGADNPVLASETRHCRNPPTVLVFWAIFNEGG